MTSRDAGFASVSLFVNLAPFLSKPSAQGINVFDRAHCPGRRKGLKKYEREWRGGQAICQIGRKPSPSAINEAFSTWAEPLCLLQLHLMYTSEICMHLNCGAGLISYAVVEFHRHRLNYIRRTSSLPRVQHKASSACSWKVAPLCFSPVYPAGAYSSVVIPE